MNRIALNMPELPGRIDPPSAYEILSNISLPTLVIWGELDFPDIRQLCQHLIRVIPAGEDREMLGTAHLPNLEKPEMFNDLLRAFLEDND